MEENTKKTGPPNFNELEQDILKIWEENKTFEKSLEQTKGNEPFVFYDGPPFATGLPHYGSILPSVIKDAVPRYQTMNGKFVRRRWGWDCHGLPIENMIEQQLGISGKKQIEELGIDKFNQACRENVLKYVDEWGKTVKRIARWVDFDNSYKTMDTSFMESVWWGLKQMWDKDLIYEDRKVLLYCPRCETPISNFEVAMDNSYRDISETSVYVKFKLHAKQRILDSIIDENTYVLAWTTTPWTLPGNTALNVGPEIRYVLVKSGEEKYVLAKDRLSILNGEYEVVSEFSSRSLVGLSYEPLFNEFIDHVGDSLLRAHRIYAADFVTVTDGTGIVHNAAMYGEEDYEVAKVKGLPRKEMLDQKGQFLPFMHEKLRGLFFVDANRVVLDELTTKNLVYKEEVYKHSYPFCWRCGTQLYYNAIPAWFVAIQKIKKDLLSNNESINWYPAHLKHGRFMQGIENAPDWNISRNRYWATALPFWKCTKEGCKNVVCVGSVVELAEKSKNFAKVYPDFNIEEYKTSQSAEVLNKLDLHRPYIDDVILECSDCGSDMKRIPEVIDCWVESGSMPFAELHYPFENREEFLKRFPSDFVVEYIPQTRAWFYVMHVVSSIIFDRAPFKNVVTTGTILAEDGSKMSKSKKNYPDPNLILEKYGADALRFYLLTSPVVNGEDMNFSETGVNEVSKKMNLILYNVWSFYRLYTDMKVTDLEIPAAKNVLDVWALEKIKELEVKVSKDLDVYDSVRGGKLILEWVNDLSTWYVRRSRDRLKEKDEVADAGLKVYGYVLATTAKLLAPFMPYLSEFIYRDITGNESVHLSEWPKSKTVVDEDVVKAMEIVREIVSLGHNLRKEHKLSVRQPLVCVGFVTKNADITLTPEHLEVICAELNVKEVVSFESIFKNSGTVVVEGLGVVSKVALDTELTEELKSEGLARDLERQVQDLRKKSGLQVNDLVDLYYNTSDEEIEKTLLEKFDRKKTSVSQISKTIEVEVDFEIQAEVQGKAIWFGMTKI